MIRSTFYRFPESHLKLILRRTVFESRLLPGRPKIFHGRETELERLVGQALVGCSAPLGIVGPGGIGKTTLALKVLHEPRVCSHFSKERFFLSCDGASSTDEVLAQLAYKLSIQRSHDQPLWSAIIDNINSRERTFLVLDNFESIWSSTDSELRETSEVLLARLSVLEKLTLLVTTRDNSLPENFAWANVETADLDTLSSTAAYATFMDLTCLRPEVLTSEPEKGALTTLLREVDFMPLAVTLLSRLDDLPSSLLREWHDYYTEVLEADRHDGTRRELSVEVSIKISLAHLPVETSSIRPRQLLSVLGQLPAGLFPSVSIKLHDTVANISSAADFLLRHSLVYTSGTGELKMLSPVRHYAARVFPMSTETQAAVEGIYLGIARNVPNFLHVAVDGPEYDVELSNIFNVLTAAVDRLTDALIGAIIDLAAYCRQRQQPCLPLLHKLRSQLDERSIYNAHCLMAIAFQYDTVDRLGPALEYFEQAAKLFAELGDGSLEAMATQGIAYILTRLGRDEEAKRRTLEYQRLICETSENSYAAPPLPGEDLAAAEQRYRAAREVKINAGDDMAVIRLFGRIIDVVSERNDAEALSTELELAVVFGEQKLPGSLWLATIKAGLARHYLDRENLEGADTLLVEAYAIMSEHNDRRGLAAVTRRFG